MTRPLRLVASAGISIPEIVSEPQSFEDFFEAESPALFLRLCLITGNRHEAEEVMQDAFLSLFERWDRVRDMEDPTGYLYRTAFHARVRLGHSCDGERRRALNNNTAAKPSTFGRRCGVSMAVPSGT